MKVLGFDPGLRNFGICVADYNLTTYKLTFEKMTTMRTSPSDCYTAVQDLVARAEDLTENLIYFVEEGRDYTDVYGICSEGFSRPPNVTSAIMLGAANGIVGALMERWRPQRMYVRTPQHIRKKLIAMPGKKTPPEEMVHTAMRCYPEVEKWIHNNPKYMHEHVLDAVAAVAAAAGEGMLLP